MFPKSLGHFSLAIPGNCQTFASPKSTPVVPVHCQSSAFFAGYFDLSDEVLTEIKNSCESLTEHLPSIQQTWKMEHAPWQDCFPNTNRLYSTSMIVSGRVYCLSQKGWISFHVHSHVAKAKRVSTPAPEIRFLLKLKGPSIDYHF